MAQSNWEQYQYFLSLHRVCSILILQKKPQTDALETLNAISSYGKNTAIKFPILFIISLVYIRNSIQRHSDPFHT